MKLSILTTITNPVERQDRWVEAIACYKELADEVVVVDGSDIQKKDFVVDQVNKVKYVHLPWPQDWNWIELPKHLNAGLEVCTGDWILKLDIDQFINEKDFDGLRGLLTNADEHEDALTLQKMSMLYGGRYFQKGPMSVLFRNKPYIKIGKDINERTDLCFPIKFKEYESVGDYQLPTGTTLPTGKLGIQYWNYDYFFKTKEFTQKEFWRFSQAYHRYFGAWTFGTNEEVAMKVFLNMMKGRYVRAPYTYKLEDHSKYIRKAVEELKLEQFGYNGWGLV